MNDEAIIAEETPIKKKNDTRRSWIALLKLVSALSFCLAAIIGFIDSYSEYSVNGNSQTEISEFQSSLTLYVTECRQASFSTLGLDFDQSGFNPLLAGSAPLADENGHPSTADLDTASKRLTIAFSNLSPVNKNCAKEAINQAQAEYNRKQLSSSEFIAPLGQQFEGFGWKLSTTQRS